MCFLNTLSNKLQLNEISFCKESLPCIAISLLVSGVALATLAIMLHTGLFAALMISKVGFISSLTFAGVDFAAAVIILIFHYKTNSQQSDIFTPIPKTSTPTGSLHSSQQDKIPETITTQTPDPVPESTKPDTSPKNLALPIKHNLKQQSFLSTIAVQTKQAAHIGFMVGDDAVYLDGDITKQMKSGTVFYKTIGLELEDNKLPPKAKEYTTEIIIKNQDTLDCAFELKAEMTEDDKGPLILNLANPKQPGGFWETGAPAQEEQLFFRSNYFQALYTNENPDLYENQDVYPLPYGSAILTPAVQVFRKSSAHGFEFTKPQTMDFVAAAAVLLNHPKKPPQNYVANTQQIIRAILRTAAQNGYTTLVLGALGCGMFRNDPDFIAEQFHQILNNEEFKGRFKKITFAILSSGTNQNFAIFQKKFSSQPAEEIKETPENPSEPEKVVEPKKVEVIRRPRRRFKAKRQPSTNPDTSEAEKI